MIGLGVGVGVGAIIGFASGDDEPGMVSFQAEGKAGIAAVVLGSVGALIGYAAAPGEQWESVPDSQIILGFGQGSNGERGLFISGRF